MQTKLDLLCFAATQLEEFEGMHAMSSRATAFVLFLMQTDSKCSDFGICYSGGSAILS